VNKADTQTMQCGTCISPGDFQLVEREMPQTAPEGWVLLDVSSIGLCGTDFHIFEGKHPFLNYPRVIGHEIGAVVAESAAGWNKGDTVVVNPYLYCGECRACQRGKPNCCSNIEVLGVHRDGGMCGRLAVPATNLYSAEGLTLTEAAMVEFLSIGAHAVRRSEVTKGDRVLVVGVGPIGIGAALFAQLEGADVHLMDLSETRMAGAQKAFGFDKLHKVGSDILSGDLADGFDVVFDATGNKQSIEGGFPLLAHGGTYALVSVVKDDITFSDPEFHKREMRLIGSRNALKEDFDHVIDTLRNKRIDSSKLCSEVVPMENIESRLSALVDDRDNLIKVVVKI